MTDHDPRRQFPYDVRTHSYTFQVGDRVAVQSTNRYSYRGRPGTVTKVSPTGKEITVQRDKLEGELTQLTQAPAIRFNTRSLFEVGGGTGYSGSKNHAYSLITLFRHEEMVAYVAKNQELDALRAQLSAAAEEVSTAAMNSHAGELEDAIGRLRTAHAAWKAASSV